MQMTSAGRSHTLLARGYANWLPPASLKRLSFLASFCQIAALFYRIEVLEMLRPGYRQCGFNPFKILACGAPPHRKLEWQICVATARAVHSGQVLATEEPCPRGSLRIYLAPLASRTEIPSPRPASHQGWSVAKCGWPVPL